MAGIVDSITSVDAADDSVGNVVGATDPAVEGFRPLRRIDPTTASHTIPSTATTTARPIVTVRSPSAKASASPSRSSSSTSTSSTARDGDSGSARVSESAAIRTVHRNHRRPGKKRRRVATPCHTIHGSCEATVSPLDIAVNGPWSRDCCGYWVSASPGGCRCLTVVGGFGFDRGGVGGVVGDLAVEAAVVEPVDVGHGGELDVVEAAPRSLPVDQLPLEKPRPDLFCSDICSSSQGDVQ